MAYTTIDNPELYFQTKLYAGNSSTQAITLDGSEDMQPDFVWIKNRNDGSNQSHILYDAVRGATKFLQSNSSAGEATDSNGLTAFGTDGFTLGNSAEENAGFNHVAWCWKAGAGSGSSNTDGSINTASTSVSTTSGFSISKYVGTGSNATVGHGLGVAPKMYIVKDLGATSGWRTYTEATGNQSQLALDQNSSADSGNTTMWNSTSPTSTVFSIGTHSNVNTSSNNYIAYSFAEVQGFSKFGSYKGNGDANGAFIYTGFLPELLWIKRTNDVANWVFKTKSTPTFGSAGYNPNNKYIYGNLSNAEASGSKIDFLSNGFKWRIDGANQNSSGDTFFYAAFAKAPFVNSNGVPNNAE